MNPKKLFLYFILAFSMLLCTTGIAAATAGKPIVGVSIVPQATFVQVVADNLVEVVTMVPPGNSPGNYAPTPREIQKLSKAKLYFSISVPAEQANILPKGKALNPKMKVINLATEVEKVYTPRYFTPGNRDPHIWLSPKRVKTMIEVIAKELATIDPKHQSVYNRNAQAYLKKLDQLDQTIKTIFSNKTKKNFIVFHPALGYFADDYGLNMLALQIDGKEASSKNFQKIADFAKQYHIKIIFYQEEFDSKQAQALAAEIDGKVEKFAPLASDYIENLKKIAKLLAVALK
jgi:zinc transport system substrate-binding protein